MESKEHALVSIIVPIYRVEAFLSECVESLLGQDYRNLEIILVNDGSPDRCGEILDEYAEKDPRIIVIHQENSGVSTARNAGLRIARGKYVMFVDGDDFVEPDYVSYFVQLIEESGCGIGVGKNAFVRDSREQTVTDSVILADALEIVEGIYLNHYGVAVWNKIYRRDVVEDALLRFNPAYWYAEGMLFNIMYLQHVDDAVVGNRKVYHVRENMDSATRAFKLENQYCGLRSMVLQKEQWAKTNQHVKMAWEYHYRLYAQNILQGLILTGAKKENRKLYRKCISILRRNLRIPLQTEISARMKENSILTAICPTGFIRDELGIVHDKGEHSDYLSMKALSLARRCFRKISAERKKLWFDTLKEYYQKHYKATYLEKPLL